MELAQTERFLGKLLGFTGAFTTIFIISGSVTDPVNAPKFVSIGVLGTATFAVVISSFSKTLIASHKSVLIALCFFNIFTISSLFTSQAPLTQLLYGTYGRNNGILTYIFLSFILLAALCIKSKISFQFILKGLFFAGAINLVYCLWAIIFGDFVGWYNPYGNILGTLGNPNFIGAFLGIYFAALFAVFVNNNNSNLIRIFSALALTICAFEIVKSHAVQGKVVAVFGCTIVLFLFIRSKYNNFVLISFTLLSFFGGAFALAGALQVGPLTKFIYKTSVSLRGQYWLAGWNTGESHPFTGVGMDAFGDWYRRMRDPHALELPGVNTVVNTAHNVPIDIFAFGGWPLFLSYLFLMALAGLSVFRMMKRAKKYDQISAVLISAWAGYQLQSIISINQIGLAVWGWLLSGAVIAYERETQIEQFESNKNTVITRQKFKVKLANSLPAHIPLYAFLGGIIGLVISLPPLSADLKWRSSQLQQSLTTLEKAMNTSYFNPANSNKFIMTIQTLESSQLFDLSRKYALEAVKWNPDSYDSWRTLYFIKNSTIQEKDEALRNMKRLDPLNPDVTSTK